MANDAFPLEAIQEEEPEEELEEWQTTNDPAELKHYRTQAKRIHTKSLNRSPCRSDAEDVYTVNVYRVGLVRGYDIVEKIHLRYEKVCKFDGEELDRETSWGIDISIKHPKALADVANYIDFHQARARSVAVPAAVALLTVHQPHRHAIQQERAEVLQQAEEDERMQQFEIARKAEEERMQQLETARKAEERRVEAARKKRQLQMELEKQRYTGSLLRKQLADE
ncbi:hypothetical protein OUZ56_011559 [Daphnia magna]|uniref:Uncharacterized protein n=1 Tax=Daphnia magna TaxID=35525 RepID=A0ABQ9Z0G9_9CRUS|nr:hypothetical protein OUZ56_011559 [Daphnia magna]